MNPLCRTGNEPPAEVLKSQKHGSVGGEMEGRTITVSEEFKDCRLEFAKGKQRALFTYFFEAHGFTQLRLGQTLGISKTTVRGYFHERNNVRLSTFNKLAAIDVSARQFENFIEKRLPINWGARKGGYATSALIEDKAAYFAKIREIKRLKNLHRADIKNGILLMFHEPKIKQKILPIHRVDEYYPIEKQEGNGLHENLAKFIAHVQADGCQPKNTNTFSYVNTNIHLIFEFCDLVQKLFRLKNQKISKRRNIFYVGFSNKSVAKFLEGLKFYSIDWEVPYFVKIGSEKTKASYLQSFFDDEGSVIFVPHKKCFDRAISMMLINKNGVLELIELLKCFEIECNFHGPYKGKYYELKITGKENLIKFYERIGFISLNKQRKLMEAINSYLK
ncbi:MAG: hypothetical protein HY544_05165 [Candidatus Diapherotrites archaeon]|uniref:HTH cro/C1-type domain-containing protein n=1 Tax=Candidatus Iainarchaeum sp. TaxID=3101447 RepID=A0A8T3YNN7_9ARCH|nr:hypothetical protein [Candidatus Diapherotrites archaeon]